MVLAADAVGGDDQLMLFSICWDIDGVFWWYGMVQQFNTSAGDDSNSLHGQLSCCASRTQGWNDPQDPSTT